MAAEVHLQEERYIFKPTLRRNIFILLIAGVVVFGLGLFLAMNSEGHGESAGHGKEGHASIEATTHDMTASLQHETHDEDTAADQHKAEGGEHHGPAQARDQAGPAARAHVGCRSRRAARVHEPHDQRDGAEQAAPEGHLKAFRTIEMAREDASDAPHEGGKHHGEDCAAMLLWRTAGHG